MPDLPIPTTQLHYADPAINDEAQRLPITAFVDRIHYPTLGCPALLTPERTLTVLLSLSAGEDPRAVSLALVDRHGQTGERPLAITGEPVSLGEGPEGKQGRRTLYQLSCSLEGHPSRLYDLRARTASGEETQPNAVRIYREITGDEKVVLCGDSQYNVTNAVCLERFIERINARDDIAWVALIGDVCDNSVQSEWSVIKRMISASPEPVESHYASEYRDTAGRLLPRLNKPLVLVPGNHDGMVAFENYGPGRPTDTYLGPDAGNAVAYDGLHHFRRSFGPLYHAFTWHKTRYACTNSFELDRHERLGFHAVVVNWGGWMRDEQLGWLREELGGASRAGMHKVVFSHHDPRGGALGRDLGYYSEMKRYTCDRGGVTSLSYLRYCAHHARTFQQEWMVRPEVPLADHPVRRLLQTLIDHGVWAVVMGHDNENWVESYLAGDTLLSTDPAVRTYPVSEGDEADPGLVKDAVDLLSDGALDDLAARLEGRSDADAILRLAVERLDAEGYFKPEVAYAPLEVQAWNLRAKAPIHFTHVDDVGAYKYTKEAHFADYGYVVAELHEGRPVRLQRFDLRDETPGPVVDLLEASE
ncbi:MAG: metallophosphoesterase [Byssovorax sp.]